MVNTSITLVTALRLLKNSGNAVGRIMLRVTKHATRETGKCCHQNEVRSD